MLGFVRILEWPFEGYERRILPDDCVQIDLEMVESRVTGVLRTLNSQIRITETTEQHNVGTLTQAFAEQDFPALFDLRRKVVAETPIGELHNEELIIIHAALDQVPPLKLAENLSE